MARESRGLSGWVIEEKGTVGTAGTVNPGKNPRTMKH